jgi:hypothetical protein
MRQDESPTDEEEAQDTVGFDFKLEYLISLGQMFELAFVPNFPRISHPHEERCKFLLTPLGELFKPHFRRRTSIRSHVELDAQDRTVIDQSTG